MLVLHNIITPWINKKIVSKFLHCIYNENSLDLLHNYTLIFINPTAFGG